MREIKFRAWDINKKKYYYDVQNTYESIIGDSFGNILNDEELVVEQNTGLKDKNGVEIYENDVISASVCGFPEIGLVEYSPFGEWVFGNIRLNEFMSSLNVIGNVHQNANLLDDTDRISPDDIGNDIHEFLHGGDK